MDVKLLIILAISAILVIFPAVIFDLPIVQTDGASHYVYAKVFSETLNLDSENPEYNRIGSAENKLSDYPPFVTIAFGSVLRIFGNDTFLINGGFGLAFFLLASIFIYLFLRDLTKNNTIAIIGLLFFILNVRAYYTLFTGIYPAFVSFCLSLPGLYFSYKFFSSGKMQNFVLSILFTCLTALTYTIQGVYLIFLELMLWLGMKLDEKLVVGFPKINIKIRKFSLKDFKNLFYVLIPAILFLVYVAFSFTLQRTARESWIQQWFSGLMATCTGYQCVWKHFFIVDGILFMLFAIAGAIYLFYKKEWKIVSLLFAGLFIVLSSSLFVEGAITILVFIYRFYTTFFALLIIPASIFVYKIISIKEMRNLGIFLLIACLLLQVGTLGYFYSKIEPAISENEYKAANELLKYRTAKIMYINNDIDEGTFKSFKWIVVFAKSEKYAVNGKIDDLSGFEYVFVENKNRLSDEEKKKLGNNILFDEGKTQIYRID